MAESTVYVKNYDAGELPVNDEEVWRYAGYMGIREEKDDILMRELETVLKEAAPVIHPKVCYLTYPLMDEAGEKKPLPWQERSLEVEQLLENSSSMVLMAATVGLDLDRLIARYKRVSPVKALLLHALGAERVEAVCDRFCEEIAQEEKARGNAITMRYSPGYGDLPLSVQKDFFRILDINRKIGVSLGETLLMTPGKSVTALFGISPMAKEGSGDRKKTSGCKSGKCASCPKTDCEFRRIL